MSGLQISDRLRQQLASRPCRNEALMRDFETGAAITHRARQSPPSALQRMAARLSQFGPRKRRKIDPVEATKRRRKWGGGSCLPDTVCQHYTEAERAALGVIGEQVKRHGFCELPLEKIAEMAGVSRTSVQNCLRKARSRDRNDIAVQLRPQPGRKNLTNVIRIISAEWVLWIKRSIGFKRLNPSERSREISLSQSVVEPKTAPEKGSEASSRLDNQPPGVSWTTKASSSGYPPVFGEQASAW